MTENAEAPATAIASEQERKDNSIVILRQLKKFREIVKKDIDAAIQKVPSASTSDSDRLFIVKELNDTKSVTGKDIITPCILVAVDNKLGDNVPTIVYRD